MPAYKPIALALLTTMFGASRAEAGIYGDELTKCIVKSTSPSDQETLVAWIYAAMSAYPTFKASSKLSSDQGDQATKNTADIFTRLITLDCRQQSIDTLKYEGDGALAPAFKLVGEIAMRRLMTDPSVAAFISSISTYVDPNDFEAIRIDAGLAPVEKPTTPKDQ